MIWAVLATRINSARDITLDAAMARWNQHIKADYNGWSVGAALEASRPVRFANNMYLRPAAGYSYQKHPPRCSPALGLKVRFEF